MVIGFQEQYPMETISLTVTVNGQTIFHETVDSSESSLRQLRL